MRDRALMEELQRLRTVWGWGSDLERVEKAAGCNMRFVLASPLTWLGIGTKADDARQEGRRRAELRLAMRRHLPRVEAARSFKAYKLETDLGLIWILSLSRIALGERLIWSRWLIWWQTQLNELIIIQRQELAVWAKALSLDLISPNGRLIPFFLFWQQIDKLEVENGSLIYPGRWLCVHITLLLNLKWGNKHSRAYARKTHTDMFAHTFKERQGRKKHCSFAEIVFVSQPSEKKYQSTQTPKGKVPWSDLTNFKRKT